MKIIGMRKQFWGDRFDNSVLRFKAYVNEWLTMCESGDWDSKKSSTLLRKEKVELIIQKICLVFLYGGES